MRNLKKIWENRWIWILVGGLFLIFGIPFIIHAAFKIPAPFDFLYAENWTAGDVLVFYGAIIGAVVLFFSIQLAQQNYREDARQRVLPYIAITALREKHKTLLPADSAGGDNNGNSYSTYALEHIFIRIGNGIVSYPTELTENERSLIEHGGKTPAGNTGLLPYLGITKRLFSFPIRFENTGQGAAIALQCGFNRLDSKEKRGPDFGTITPGGEGSIHIFSTDDFSDNDLCSYSLDFYYEDIAGRKYIQQLQVTLTRGKKKNTLYYEYERTAKQTEIL